MSLRGFLVITLLMALSSPTPMRAEALEQRLSPGEHHATVNGISFWYKVAGQGPVLVVQAPGWGPGSLYLQNGLAPLEVHYRLVFYDPRGSGRSSRPGDAARMSTADMVNDLDQLRQYWGLDRLNLIGHSHGGAIVLDYGVRYSARVRKLVLVDTDISGYDDGRAVRKEIDIRRNDKRFSEAIAEVNRNTMPKTDEEFGAILARELPLFFYDPIGKVPVFQKTSPKPPSAWVYRTLDAAEQRNPINVSGELGRVRARTLILVGREDWICPVSDAEKIRADVHGSQLVVFEKCGHFPWIESPHEFFSAVVSFIGQ
ncbi:MAG TPA: alpha/beta hydrolase [Terriglobia bacterium]|nr:alpha/beta hydrolase [Terriglobia bacterium]